MPIYQFQCERCEALQDLWVDPPAPTEITGGQCTTDGKPCRMFRKWTPPSIGYVKGAGGSPAR